VSASSIAKAHSLFVAANDQSFDDAFFAQIQSWGCDPSQFFPLKSAANQIISHGPGTLIVAVASPDDISQAESLIQKASLEAWPVSVFVVESETVSQSEDLAYLDPYIAGRFRCPDKRAALEQAILDKSVERSASGGQEDDDSLVGEIRRRLLGPTPSLVPLARHLELAACHDMTVLITGETGTGKTFLARLIHEASQRRQEPFLVVPCGALAANLIESELFGHARGAFTGADRAKVGRLESAGRGTILLDEIDTLSLEQQASLLRVVETGAYEPVGSHETKSCAARLIAASNWDLEKAVQEGKFRQDLWYRLNVLSIHLPPLRERVPDIGPLVRVMAANFNAKFHKGLFEICPETLAVLEDFPWPGNIRQLENAVQQAVLASKGPRLTAQHLPQAVRHPLPIRAGRASQPAALLPSGSCEQNGRTRLPAGSLEKAVSLDECALIKKALAENNYNRSRTASVLGISRVTLYKKMKRYGLHVNARWPME
jgi:DNA-binding NtrC family response regulator